VCDQHKEPVMWHLKLMAIAANAKHEAASIGGSLGGRLIVPLDIGMVMAMRRIAPGT
jgi:hypothetical protein